MLTFCPLFWGFFFFFPSFLVFFYVVFPLLPFWSLLECPTILLVLLFFSCSSLRVCIVSHICMHGWYLDTPHTHHIPLHDLWRPCADLDIVGNQFAPPHACQNYVLGPICVSVCLVLRLLGANASPCTHPNPCPSSWVPLYPFMSAHICVSFFGKFPGHTWPGIIPC